VLPSRNIVLVFLPNKELRGRKSESLVKFIRATEHEIKAGEKKKKAGKSSKEEGTQKSVVR
jgi:hypothetical protein